MCPQLKYRRPRCPAASDCCDGTSVSSVAASYAEQVTPYSLTVTEPPLALCFIHEILNSLSSLTPNYSKAILGFVVVR